jgi:hypothetical protein
MDFQSTVPHEHPMKLTPLEILEMMVESFQKLSPDEREQVRREIYENATGKPYRPEAQWMN